MKITQEKKFMETAGFILKKTEDGYVVAGSVRKIGHGAFALCSPLMSAEFSERTKPKKGTKADSEGLICFIIPESVKTAEERALGVCRGHTEIEVLYGGCENEWRTIALDAEGPLGVYFYSGNEPRGEGVAPRNGRGGEDPARLRGRRKTLKRRR